MSSDFKSSMSSDFEARFKNNDRLNAVQGLMSNLDVRQVGGLQPSPQKRIERPALKKAYTMMAKTPMRKASEPLETFSSI